MGQTKAEKNLHIERVLKATETVSGYPIKELKYNGGLRNYFSGLVLNPKRGNMSINNGYTGCAWDINGKAKPQSGYAKKKSDSDLDLKLI